MRSCYRGLMQFDQAGELVAEVEWYFAQDGALPLPWPTAFGSSNWCVVQRQQVGVGERWDSSYRWANGKAPPDATGRGMPCGDPDWWLNGTPSDAPRLTLSGTGLASCCNVAAGILVGGTSVLIWSASSAGGVYVGGTSVVSPVETEGVGGVLVGGSSAEELEDFSSGGVYVGGPSAGTLLYAGSGGLLVGGSSTLTLRAFGDGGLLIGGTTVLELFQEGRGGTLVGGGSAYTPPTRATYTCPGSLIPDVLHATNGLGQTFALTRDNANDWWQGVDPQHSFTTTLTGFTRPGIVVSFAVSGGLCTQSGTLNSVQCSPLLISFTIHLTGIHCLISGSYPLTIRP